MPFPTIKDRVAAPVDTVLPVPEASSRFHSQDMRGVADLAVVLSGFPKPQRLLWTSLVDTSDGNFLSQLQKEFLMGMAMAVFEAVITGGLEKCLDPPATTKAAPAACVVVVSAL